MEAKYINPEKPSRMIDVGQKADTERKAIAKGIIRMKPETLELLRQGKTPKGNVLGVAQTAGILAAKETHHLIPMCHPLLLTNVEVTFHLPEEKDADFVEITGTVKTIGKTGVEMEALTAVSTAALTIYDMCKAVDRGMSIENIRLVMKSGGKSGTYIAEE